VITFKEAVDRLTVAELDNLGNYITARKAQLDDGALMAEIVKDQRTNPVTHGLPHGLTEGNAYSMEIAERVALAKAAERAAGGNRQH
jgi:hypothetical protein